jgi:GH24 family phage-related lysozyme (muramidase)/peptidoglycan hydrolase-like protein with peptidoglycan-binding domain
MIRSSQKAVDLIVAAEIGSRAQYEKLYHYPTWPGGKSGVTIGIGYDLGYTSLETFGQQFGHYLDVVDFHELAQTIGKTGDAAREALPAVKHISVDWDTAMKVFKEVDLPKYENMLIHACPKAVNLTPDCFGALASLVYNRGPGGFHADGDRYREMRAIAHAIDTGDFAAIPGQIRSMKRLWGNEQRGLLVRRDDEAKLFEDGLKVTSSGTTQLPAPVDQYNAAMDGDYNITVELLQTKLEDGLGYFEVGTIDGKWGGRTRGAITAFMNDRGQPANNGYLTAAVVDEINKALKEGWKRPIAEARSQATPSDVDKKVPIVSQNYWQQVWATLLGVPTAVVSLVKYIFGDQPNPAGYIEPIKNAINAIPPELYLIAVVGICIAVFVQARKVQSTTTKAYQEGKIN